MHFSLLYLVPEHRLGVFLVHAMRQGGPHRSLRTDFVRALLSRFFPQPEEAPPPASSHSWPPAARYAGVYRPHLLSTSTIERGAQLAMDTRVRVHTDGSATLRIPGGPTLALRRVGPAHYRAHGGPDDGLHIAFLDDGKGGITGFAMSGSTQDPVSFERLRWLERGWLHAAFLGAVALLLVGTAVGSTARHWIGVVRRRRVSRGQASPPAAAWAWRDLVATGWLVLATPVTAMVLVAAHPGEDTAAHGLRLALRVGLTFLLAGAVTALPLPAMAVMAWRRGYWGRARRVYFAVVAAGVAVALPLLYRYRILGYWF